MVQPIDHNNLSAASTTASAGIKGGLFGAAVAWIIPAVLFVATIASGGAMLAAGGALAFAGYAALTALSAIATFASGAAAATATPWLAGGGGLIGLIKGHAQVQSEKMEYQKRVDAITKPGEIKSLQQGYMVGHSEGAQAGFQQGAQYGAQAVVHQLQAAAAQHMAAQQQMAQPQEAVVANNEPLGKHTAALASCKCESKVEMIDKQRAEAAASTNQIG